MKCPSCESNNVVRERRPNGDDICQECLHRWPSKDSERSPLEKLAMLQELMGGEETCPTCGHTTERPSMITEEQAMELLGFKK
jgi:transposase-like protein